MLIEIAKAQEYAAPELNYIVQEARIQIETRKLF